jgi:hypothetical protein
VDRFITKVYAQSSAPARQLGDIDDMVADAFNKIWPFFGIALFAMFIYGGAMWMMSAGDPQRLQKAQGTLLWAVVGIFILALLMWLMGTFEMILGITPGSIGTFTI